jgi:hypothetical protein
MEEFRPTFADEDAEGAEGAFQIPAPLEDFDPSGAEMLALATGAASGLPVETGAGSRGVAVPTTEREMSLYQRFLAYDEKTRGRMVELEQRLATAFQAVNGPLFSGQPDELDDEILALFDKI